MGYNTAMSPDGVTQAAKKNDANTAEALKAAQAAVTSLVALKGTGLFGTSPAGKSTGQVFDAASTVIDELIAEVNSAIAVLNANLHASVDAVVKKQESAQADYAKLTSDNQKRVDTIGQTGIKPGDPGYVAPQPATQTLTDPPPSGTGQDSGGTSTPPDGSGTGGNN